MANDPAGPFRTKVRVKGAATEAVQPDPAVRERPASLMEALKQAASNGTPEGRPSGTVHEPLKRPVRKPAAAVSRWVDEPDDPDPPRRFRRPRTTRVGRLAAAKLRQLERLKEAAASLESLARGEVEEATVEIVRRDRRPHAGNRRPQPFLPKG